VAGVPGDHRRHPRGGPDVNITLTDLLLVAILVVLIVAAVSDSVSL
jgi:hypothetical protein